MGKALNLEECLGMNEAALMRNFKSIVATMAENLMDHQNYEGFSNITDKDEFYEKLSYLETETKFKQNTKFETTIKDVRKIMEKFRAYQYSKLTDKIDFLNTTENSIYEDLEWETKMQIRLTRQVILLKRLENYLDKEPILKLVS